GHEVSVLTSDHGEVAAGTDHGPVRVRRALRLFQPFGEAGRVSRRARWHIHRVNRQITADHLADERPDLVFVWSQLRLTLGAAQAAEQSGLPVCYTFNDEHLAGYLPRRWAATPRALAGALADRTLFRDGTTSGLRLSHATAISRRVVDNLVAAGAPVATSRVVYQGIPVERFPCKANPGSVGTPARVLYAGQLHPTKGVDTLIDAMHRLAAARPGSAPTLTIAGDGPAPYPESLRRLAAGGPARIEFLGKVAYADLPALYRAHDLFVFPSRWQEPFGLTHLEAMASGLPVVSTADGGHGEFLRDSVNALVFQKGNEEALAERIGALLDDPGLGKRLALAGRVMVERDFSLARYVTDLEQWLEEVRRARAA
ncbi:MAG TPA: glycosyltransferase family 4 protein, partial [Gemmatimonadales bacterium]